MTASRTLKKNGNKKQNDSKQQESVAIDTLKDLKKNLERKRKPSAEDLEKFKELSAVLSSLLPKTSDRTLFEIDDLMYPNDDSRSKKRSKCSVTEFFASRCFDSFHYVFCRLELEYKSPPCRILDATYLQLLEQTSYQVFKSNCSWFNTMRYICYLIESKSTQNICRAIKLIKMAVNRHKQFINEEIKRNVDAFTSFSYLMRLKNIPDGRQQLTKRIISWLTKQSSNILCKLKFEPSIECLQDSMKAFRKLDKNIFDKEYIQNVQKVVIRHQQVDCLYKYFSTAENEEQELQRAKDFLAGISEANKDPSMVFSSSLCADIDQFFSSFLESCECSEKLLKITATFDEVGLQSSNRKAIDDDDNDDDDDDDGEVKGGDDDDYEKDDEEKDDDCIIEKFLVHDEFFKILYVQSKIYNIFKEFAKNDKSLEGWDSRAFRNGNCLVNKFINNRLSGGPSKGDELPWWFQIVLSKCPFLFLSERHQDLLDDLVKVLKGEDIDDITFEKLSFAVNSCNVDDGVSDK